MPHTVIIGAGIIGVSTAYFLSHAPNRQLDHKITVLDPCPPASGASGKAGGFIARNWAGAATASLAELSFRLHDELAQQHGGAENWGYRRCRAVSVVGRNARGNPMGDLTRSVRLKNVEKMDSVGALEWIKPGVIQDQNLLGDNDAIAQCDPYLLTTFLLAAAKSKGMEFLQAAATKLSIENNRVSQVHVVGADGRTFFIPCDSVVLAAGPWTGPLSESLLPDHPIPISSYAGHSLIIRPSTPVTVDCLFMTLTTRKSSYHPEIFPRASGEIYVCGVNDNLPLPATPTAANPRAKDIAKVKEIADAIFPATYIIEKEQLCFRPMTAHGDPFVCRVPHVEGVFVGAGHNFWGITLGPGTGKVLSEMVLGVEMSADVDELCL